MICPHGWTLFLFARFAHYYPRCCMMFPTKFPQSFLLAGKWFLTTIQSNDPKIEGADACKLASRQLCSFISTESRFYGHLAKT
jgi:hypothetical protein